MSANTFLAKSKAYQSLRRQHTAIVRARFRQHTAIVRAREAAEGKLAALDRKLAAVKTRMITEEEKADIKANRVVGARKALGPMLSRHEHYRLEMARLQGLREEYDKAEALRRGK